MPGAEYYWVNTQAFQCTGLVGGRVREGGMNWTYVQEERTCAARFGKIGLG